jgi:threonine aldolase
VFVDPTPAGLSATDFAARLAERGVEVSTLGTRNRFCTHLDVSADDVEAALDIVAKVL